MDERTSHAELAPWPAPDGGFGRQLRVSRRQQPWSRRKTWQARVSVALLLASYVAVLAIGGTGWLLPTLVLLVPACASLLTLTRHQFCRLLGLRPPSGD